MVIPRSLAFIYKLLHAQFDRNLIIMLAAQVLALCVTILEVSGWGRRGRHDYPNWNNNGNGNQQNDSPFVCVPIGTCPSGSGGIDPRIVTPNQITCPAGQMPCYVSCANQNECGSRRSSSVSNAPGPTTNGSFPWQAYVENRGSFVGSGALVNRIHILTAAHKVYNVRPQDLTIYLGVWNPPPGYAQRRTAQRIIVHEGFLQSPQTYRNDIAIVRLNAPVQFNDVVVPICLPNQGQNFVNRQRCVVSGWGQTAFNANDAASNQRQSFVPIVDYQTCRRSMSQANVNVNIFLDPVGDLCAGGVAQNDACTQDGGAPLVCPNGNGRFELAGLVIWGVGCGRANVYGVYVNVAQYRNWINEKIC